MAPQVMAHPEARPTRRLTTVDTNRIPPAGDPFTSQDHDDTLEAHICNSGWITIGQMVVDEETGEETVEEALYLCRRCADSRPYSASP